jgi:hypothetical protein
MLTVAWVICCAIVYPLQRQVEGQVKANSHHDKAILNCGQLPGSLSGAERLDCFDVADENWKNATESYSLKRFYLLDVAFWPLPLPAIIVPPLVAYGLAVLGVWIWRGFKPPVVLLLLLCVFGSVSQAQVKGDKLITDAEYKTFLFHLEAELPKWENALKSIDPEQDSKISYLLGKSIVTSRNVGLLGIGNIRHFVAKQRVKRTVYGELALHYFLTSVYDAMNSVVSLEVAGGLTLSNLEKYAPDISAVSAQIGVDVFARVAMLEDHVAPASEVPKWYVTEIPLTVSHYELPGYEYASADGFWKSTSTSKDKQLMDVIAVKLSCVREEQKCREADASMFMGIMEAQLSDYDITSWTKDGIVADDSDKCNRHTLAIDFKANSVTVTDYPLKQSGGNSVCKPLHDAYSYALHGGQLQLFPPPSSDVKLEGQ